MSSVEKERHFIIKTTSQSSPLDEYINKVEAFRGRMCTLANSIEILLDDILTKLKIEPPTLLSRKIDKLKADRVRSLLSKSSPDLNKLISELELFNKNWRISKHGITSADKENPEDITLFYKNNEYIFDKNKINDIQQKFFNIQQELIKIQKYLA